MSETYRGMTAREFNDILYELGWDYHTASAKMKIGLRTVRRWGNDQMEVPPGVAAGLARLLLVLRECFP